MVTVNVAKESPDRVLSELQKLDYPKEKIHLSIVNAVCTLIFNISKSNYISMVLPLLPLVGKGIRRLGQKLFSTPRTSVQFLQTGSSPGNHLFRIYSQRD